MPEWLPPAELGRRIKAVRLGLGLSQEGLARRLGIPGSQAEISKWERGLKEPPAERLIDLAEEAGVTVSVFQPSAGDGRLMSRGEMFEFLVGDTARPLSEPEGIVLDPDGVLKQFRKYDQRESDPREAWALKMDYLDLVEGVYSHHGEKPGWIARMRNELKRSEPR